jgi:hypothetical protein
LLTDLFALRGLPFWLRFGIYGGGGFLGIGFGYYGVCGLDCELEFGRVILLAWLAFRIRVLPKLLGAQEQLELVFDGGELPTVLVSPVADLKNKDVGKVRVRVLERGELQLVGEVNVLARL